MWEFLQALALAAISGISFIAYKHPKSYALLFPWLVVACVLIMNVIGGWDLSNQKTYSAVSKYIAPNSIGDAQNAADSVNISFWFMWVMSALSFYFSFLLFLPNLLKHDKVKNKDD